MSWVRWSRLTGLSPLSELEPRHEQRVPTPVRWPPRSRVAGPPCRRRGARRFRPRFAAPPLSPARRHKGAPGRIRTCDARFRKPTLYPLSYEGRDGVADPDPNGSRPACEGHDDLRARGASTAGPGSFPVEDEVPVGLRRPSQRLRRTNRRWVPSWRCSSTRWQPVARLVWRPGTAWPISRRRRPTGEVGVGRRVVPAA